MVANWSIVEGVSERPREGGPPGRLPARRRFTGVSRSSSDCDGEKAKTDQKTLRN